MAKRKQVLMDKAGKRLEDHLAVVNWFHDHWHRIPEVLYDRKDTNGGHEYIPVYVRHYFLSLLREDFVDIITPAVKDNWTIFAADNGVVLPDEPDDDAKT